jgi:hypothetical protein
MSSDLQPRPFVATLAIRAVVLGLCSYGMLYYAYKYYQPWFGGNDFADYYAAYLNPFQNEAVDPFRFRRISALVTFIIYKAGLYYPVEIAFHDPAYSQQLFFAALLSNYIALWGAALICSYIATDEGATPILSGLLVLVGFGAQAFVLTGLTEGWSWFLVAIGFYCYDRRHYRSLWLVLLASVFQRETILVVFGTFACVDTWRRRHDADGRMSKWNVLVALAAFALYLVQRWVDSVPSMHTTQLYPASLWEVLRGFVPSSAFAIPAFLTQNLLVLYAVLVVLLRFSGQRSPGYGWHLAAAAGALALGGVAAGIGNNTGRILTVLTPIVAPLAGAALTRLKV